MSGAPLDGYQDYSECVNVTHCSWLMMAGAFEENLGADEIERAKTASAALGYDFTVTDARVMKIFGKIYAFVTIKNTGVAPIYYDLGVSFGVGNEKNAQWTKAENQKLCRLMPGKSAVFSAQISIDDGQSLFVRIEKPLLQLVRAAARRRVARAREHDEVLIWKKNTRSFIRARSTATSVAIARERKSKSIKAFFGEAKAGSCRLSMFAARGLLRTFSKV